MREFLHVLMVWITKRWMRCHLALHQGRLLSLVGLHGPPAVKSWIFKFSRVQTEKGRQNKLPLYSSKGIMEQVCIHFLVSEIQAHYPCLNLLPAHTDAVFSGRCQSSSWLHWNLEEQET